MILQHLCVFRYHMCCSTAGFIPLQLIIDFHYFRQFVCEIVLQLTTTQVKIRNTIASQRNNASLVSSVTGSRKAYLCDVKEYLHYRKTEV